MLFGQTRSTEENKMKACVTKIGPAVAIAEERSATSQGNAKAGISRHLFYIKANSPSLATRRDYYMALATWCAISCCIRWVSTAEAYTRQQSRTVAYLSAEFLDGPHLGNNLVISAFTDRSSSDR